MVDVVGLRFVTEGQSEALKALGDYQRGIKTLADMQDKHVVTMNRAVTEFNRIRAAMDPGIAASQRYAAAQEGIRAAFTQGLISAQKMTAALAQLAAQYKTEQAQRFADAQRKVGDALIYGDATVKRLNTDMQSLTEKFRQGTLTASQHRDALNALARQLAVNNGYLTANGALNTQKAIAELRAAQATRDAAAATAAAAAADAAALANKQRLTQAYQQLQAALNPTIARMQQMRQTSDMLRAAVAAGVITMAQARQSLIQYRDALRAAQAQQQQMALGMNRTAVLTQQAGYQFGDFFVQIQSGTNVLVAFGQQATQLIGTFAMLATTARLVAVFSGLAVLVAIGTAIGAAMMRASGSSQTLEQRLNKLNEAARKTRETFDLLARSDLPETFGDLAGDIEVITQAMLGLDRAATLNNLMNILKGLETAADPSIWQRAGNAFLQGMSFGGPGFLEGASPSYDLDADIFARTGFDMAEATYDGYIARMKELAAAGDVEGVTAEFARFFEDATDGADGISDKVAPAGIIIAQSMRDAALSIAEMAAELNGSAQAARDATAGQERLAEAARRLNEALNEDLREGVELHYAMRDALVEREAGVQAILAAVAAETTSLRQQQRIQEIILQYGADSIQLRELEADLARQAFVQDARAAGIKGNNLRTLMAEYDLLILLTEQAKAKADQEERDAKAQERGLAALVIRAGLALDRADAEAAEAAEREAAAFERGVAALAIRAGLALDRADAEAAEAAEREAAAFERGVAALGIRAGLALDRADAEAAEAAEREAIALERGTAALVIRAGLALDRVAAEEAQRAAVEERIAQYEREIALNQTILAYGEASAEVEAIRREQAMAAVEAYIQQNAALFAGSAAGQELAQRLRAAAGAAFDTASAAAGVTNNLNAATAQAQALANVLGFISGLTAGINLRVAGLRAGIAAAQAGADQYAQTAAATLATERARLAVQLSSPDMGERMAAQQALEDLNAALETETELLREQAAIRDSMSAGGPSGSGTDATAESAERLTEAYNRLMSQLDPTIAAQQKMAEGMKVLTDAYQAGVISAQQFADAQDLLRASFDGGDGDEPWYISSLEDFGGALADLIESGGKDFESFTRTMVRSFSNAVAQMVAEWVAGQLAMKAAQAGAQLGGIVGGIVGAAVGFGLGKAFNLDGTPKADAREAERLKLEKQLLELQGRTRRLRELEIRALDGQNRALGRRIQRLEEEARIAAERDALELQLLELQGNTAEIRRRELAALDASNRALQEHIWMLEDQAVAAAEAAAVQQERMTLEQQRLTLLGREDLLREQQLAALDESNRALQEQIWALEDQAAAAEEAARIADERAGLERQLLELQGDTAALRALELEQLDASNRALQEQIWALEDQAAAAEEAARIASERADLERQLLQIQGNTAELRRRELEALDPANRALQEQIWLLEDMQAVAEERESLERRLLELQGDTAALRAMDLAALDESNRALQEQIWALEDMQRALDALDMNDFMSLVDYNRAVAQANAGIMGLTANTNGVPSAASISTVPMPPVTNTTPITTSGSASSTMTDAQVRDAIRNLTDITQQLLTRIDNNTRRSRDILTVWDEDGLPEERVA